MTTPLRMTPPTVGVVIPTTGRATVVRAIRSVLDQTYGVQAVVVVVDGPVSRLAGLELPQDPRVRTVTALPERGGNAARAVGIRSLTTDLVALLDDDDEWLAEKLEKQVAAWQEHAAASGQSVVVACRALEVEVDGSPRKIFPRKVIQASDRVADYLFVRRSLRPDGGKLASSMLLFDRCLVDVVPLATDLPRHQDWDWLLRVDDQDAATIIAVEETCLRYTIQAPADSTSVARGWRGSWDWVQSRPMLTPRDRADFLLCITAPIAMVHGDRSGVAFVFRAVLRSRAASLNAWLYALAHLLKSELERARASAPVLTDGASKAPLAERSRR
jgi:glycosyltransferase involved in cell wall biosynthesis